MVKTNPQKPLLIKGGLNLGIKPKLSGTVSLGTKLEAELTATGYSQSGLSVETRLLIEKDVEIDILKRECADLKRENEILKRKNSYLQRSRGLWDPG